MIFFSLIQTGELILRKSVFHLPELISIFIGLLFIGLARMSNVKTLQMVFGNLANFKTEITFSDSIKINPAGSFLLILNFIVSFTLLVLLFTKHIFTNSINHYLFSIGITGLVVLIYLSGFFLTGYITGNLNRLKIGQYFNLNFIHVTGLFALVIAIPWVLNPEFSKIFELITIIAIVSIYLIRLLKIVSVVIRENIPFYYLILYLCTLEIFPIYFYISVFWKYFQI